MNLLNAIRLLDLRDDQLVHLAKRPEQAEAPSYSVRDLRRRFDLRRVDVRKINPYHFRYCGEIWWEFIIENWEDVTGCKDYGNPRLRPQQEIKRKPRR